MAPFVARPSDLAATVPSPRWLPAGPNNRNNVEVSIVELKVGRPEAKNTIEKEMLRRLQFGCQGFLRRGGSQGSFAAGLVNHYVPTGEAYHKALRVARDINKKANRRFL
ncbi:hypothetical protein B296_00058083 [Ensete ventricosum]|uniref:Uncharacterized protein n=1 Tax=Ensete ventricosum TaxID=4639 RepID=A0A426XNI2_ENSVE|nr:hypothetical protein B296_00058083 [Ensete ventricosum]